MFTLFLSGVVSIRSWLRSRAALQVAILALRHQVTVLKSAQRGRIRLSSADRPILVWLSRLWARWRSALLIVEPETVIAWHRREFRRYWRWKSRLCGADRHVWGSLCLSRLGPREAASPPFQRHLPRQLGMGGTTE